MGTDSESLAEVRGADGFLVPGNNAHGIAVSGSEAINHVADTH